MARRCGGLPVLAAGLLLLAGAAPGEESPLTTTQQAVIDSLQHLNEAQGIEAVLALVAEHLPAARAADDSAFVMRLVGARGAANTMHLRASQGMDDLRQALALATALGDSLSVARLTLWSARNREVQGQHAASLPFYRRLVHLGHETGRPRFEARGLVGLAWDGVVMGDFHRADSLYVAAIDRAIAADDSFTILWARNGRGLCFWNLGQLARADTAFASTRREARQRGIAMVESAALNNHAGLLEVLGRPGEALQGYRRARELSLAAGALREAFPASMNIARCQQQLGQLEDAAATVEGLVDEARAAGFRDLVPPALEHLAQIRMEQDRPVLAARYCREGLAMADVLMPRHEVQLRLALAGALAMQDSLDAALAAAHQAIELPNASEDLHMRTEAAVTSGAIHVAREEYDAAAAVFTAAATDVKAAGMVNHQLLLESHAGDALLRAGRPEAARPWLLQALALWESTRTLPDDPIWRERRSVAARRLFESLAELTLMHPAEEAAADRQRRCFDLLQHYKARTLLERTLGPGRELAEQRPVTLDELQRATLRPGEVFLDCYLGDRHGLLFAVTRDTLLVQPLRDRSAVAATVDVMQGQLDAPDRTVATSALMSLASGLAVDLEALPRADGLAGLLAGAHSLVWSPDGALHQVPLALFFDELGVAPTRCPSATFLANLRRGSAPAPAAPMRVLAVAGTTDAAGAPLLGTLREVRWLADRFQGVDVVADTNAGDFFGGRDPAAYGLLHLASHAESDAERPWNSSLILGGHDGSRRLLAGEVAELDLGARLAVLASCSSASGAFVSGEGMLGLASGFLSAGVPAVVATLWPVEDHHAELFCHRFYGELADGGTIAEALQGTRAWLRERRETAHPFHWATYVLLGDGNGVVPLEESERTGPAVWIAALSALVAAGVTVLRRRRQRSSVKARVEVSPSASSRAK